MRTPRSADTGHGSGAGDPAARAATLNHRAAALLATDPAEAARLAASALDLAEAADDAALLGRTLHLLGQADLRRGESGSSQAHLERAAACFVRAEQPGHEFEARLDLGRLHLSRAEPDPADAHLRRALDLANARGDVSGRGRALNLLARIAHQRGDAHGTLQALEEALDAFRQARDPSGEISALTNVGLTLTGLGHYAEALARLHEAYTLARQHAPHDTLAQGTLLVNIGFLHMEAASYDLALQTLTSAEHVGQQGGHASVRVTAHLNLAEVLVRLGRLDEAESRVRAGHALIREHGLRVQEGFARIVEGQLRAERGDLAEAQRLFEDAIGMHTALEDPSGEADARVHLARLFLRQDDPALAMEQLHRAAELARALGRRRALFDVEGLRSDAAEAMGDHRAALAHYRHYHELARELFNEQRERQAAHLSNRIELERARHEAELYRLRIEAAQFARAEAEAQVRTRTQELEVAQHEVVTRLALAAEYRDDVTGKHTWRVGHFAGQIARTMGVADDTVELLRVAARLHDVGKIGIPDHILLKPGKFTDEEYEEMKSHTVRGAHILSGSRSALLQMAEVIALTHHERWDGRGYPAGLSGEAIPLVGRIVAVADVFDALTHERPYKRAWTREEALAEIERQRGAQFDPGVVDAALRTLDDPAFFERLERDLATLPQAAPPDLRRRSERPSRED